MSIIQSTHPSLEWLQSAAASQHSLYALIDAAQDDSIYQIIKHSGRPHANLFIGDRRFSPHAAEELAANAPYLIKLREDDPTSQWLLNDAWQEYRPLLIQAGQTGLAQLREHLQQFNRAYLPDGDQVLFRYYDPDILHTYISSCRPIELDRFFGPCENFWAYTRYPEHLIRLSRDEDGLLVCHAYDAVNLRAMGENRHPQPNDPDIRQKLSKGTISLRYTQYEVFERYHWRKFEHKAFKLVCESWPRHHNELGDKKLKEELQQCIARARNYGLVKQLHIMNYINTSIALGYNFEQDVNHSWAKSLLENTDDADTRVSEMICRTRVYLEEQKSK